jgi:hypothetical protein
VREIPQTEHMGTLTYGNAQRFEFEDRLLAHMKLAIVAKLLRHESFLLNWNIPVDQGSGRMSVWISRDTLLTFRFVGSRPPTINARWVEALALTSLRTGGMQVLAEGDVDALLGSRPPLVPVMVADEIR